MADEPKIIPDPPPARPSDVRVSPDPAPAVPHDVPTFPDPAPRVPFDVPVTDDPGPRGTFDVKVTPDPGPRSPIDVPTPGDPPPARPFDVSTSPDPGPRKPFDVATVADPAPRQPVDVPVTNDPPPRAPFQVGTPADPGPRLPFDVPTTLDPPPRVPVNVPITPDPPPRPTFQVPTVPDLPPVLVKGQGPGTPTLQQIIDAVGRFDSALGSFLNDILEIDPITAAGPGNGAADPRALASWFKSYVGTVGAGGLARFIAEQSVLYGMNPVVARIFNPAYFAEMLIPGSMGHVHTTIDTQAGVTMDRIVQAQDEVLQAQVRLTPANPAGDQDVYGPTRTPVGYGHTSDVGQDFTVDEMVDAGVDNVAHPFLTYDPHLGVKRFDASKYFDGRNSFGAQTAGAARRRQRLGAETVQNREAGLAGSAFIEGVIPAAFPGEGPDGAIYTPTPDPSGIGNVDDDDARIPLCFTDLRRDPNKRAYRSVYFRPMNLQFSTAFAPEYQENAAFGRVDPTVAYMRTTRTVSLSFEMHAFSPEDLQVMYNKMVWLQSMVYPSYTADSLFQSGPVIRLRIGDAVGTSAGGLPGVIRSLSFDFGDALWELRKGMKVPRSFKVSIDFLALHDGPVGLLNGTFGVFQLPPGGNAPDKNTNLAGGPTDSRTDGPPGGATAIPGGFTRFGEPTKRG